MRNKNDENMKTMQIFTYSDIVLFIEKAEEVKKIISDAEIQILLKMQEKNPRIFNKCPFEIFIDNDKFPNYKSDFAKNNLVLADYKLYAEEALLSASIKINAILNKLKG